MRPGFGAPCCLETRLRPRSAAAGLRPGAADAAQQLLQRGRLQRLAQVVVEAAGEEALAVALQRLGRQRDEEGRLRAQLFADQARRLEPSISGIWMSISTRS